MSTHGITGGFSGFIYTSELVDFFDHHEEEILDIIESLNMTPNDLVGDVNSWDINEIKTRSVWVVVESWCHDMVSTMSHDG